MRHPGKGPGKARETIGMSTQRAQAVQNNSPPPTTTVTLASSLLVYTAAQIAGLWLPRNEVMDHHGSPYITSYIVVSIFLSIPSFPAKESVR